MKHIPTPVVLVLLALTGCSEKHSGQHEQAHAHHHVESGDLEIALNDGQKWQMDDHTRAMLQAMSARVQAGGKVQEVGKGLESDLETLIQGCTMTGESHNQLHVFLMAFIPAVDAVSTTGSTESLGAVGKLLEAYPAYFE